MQVDIAAAVARKEKREAAERQHERQLQQANAAAQMADTQTRVGATAAQQAAQMDLERQRLGQQQKQFDVSQGLENQRLGQQQKQFESAQGLELLKATAKKPGPGQFEMASAAQKYMGERLEGLKDPVSGRYMDPETGQPATAGRLAQMRQQLYQEAMTQYGGGPPGARQPGSTGQTPDTQDEAPASGYAKGATQTGAQGGLYKGPPQPVTAAQINRFGPAYQRPAPGISAPASQGVTQFNPTASPAQYQAPAQPTPAQQASEYDRKVKMLQDRATRLGTNSSWQYGLR